VRLRLDLRLELRVVEVFDREEFAVDPKVVLAHLIDVSQQVLVLEVQLEVLLVVVDRRVKLRRFGQLYSALAS